MTDLIAKSVWPVVVLVLGITFLFRFKESITTLLVRTKSASFGKDKVIVFGEANIDGPRSSAETKSHPLASQLSSIRWQNSGNLFWLGHDLMWTIQMALRGAPLATIMHGLTQANYHLHALNLDSTPGGLRLAELTVKAQRSEDAQWDLQRRDAFASVVDEVLDDLGFLIEAHQPDFQQDLRKMTTSAKRIGARGAAAE